MTSKSGVSCIKLQMTVRLDPGQYAGASSLCGGCTQPTPLPQSNPAHAASQAKGCSGQVNRQFTKSRILRNTSLHSRKLTSTWEFLAAMWLITHLLSLALVVVVVAGEKTLVIFQKENYIVEGGCPSEDTQVLKWVNQELRFYLNFPAFIFLHSFISVLYYCFISYFWRPIFDHIAFIKFRWRKFCNILHKNATVCVTELYGRQKLTVPKFRLVVFKWNPDTFQQCLRRPVPRPHESGHDQLSGDQGRDRKTLRGQPSVSTDQDVYKPLFDCSSPKEAHESKRMILSYRNSEYIAVGGCPSKDPVAHR